MTPELVDAEDCLTGHRKGEYRSKAQKEKDIKQAKHRKWLKIEAEKQKKKNRLKKGMLLTAHSVTKCEMKWIDPDDINDTSNDGMIWID